MCRPSDAESMNRIKAASPDMFASRATHVSAKKTPPSQLDDNFLKLVYGETLQNVYTALSDVTADLRVSVEGKAFPCHQRALIGWSGYFQRLPRSEAADPGEIHLEDDAMTASSFSSLLDWVYGRELTVTLENLCELMTTARFLQMDSVVDFLERYYTLQLGPFVDTFPGGDLVILYCQAKRHNHKQLVKTALEGILQNFEKVYQSLEFVEMLEKDDLMQLLESEELAVSSEDVVCQAAFTWLRHGESRLDDMEEIVTSLRLGLIEARTLYRTLDRNIVSKSDRCFQILMLSLFGKQDADSLQAMKEDHPDMFQARQSTWRKVLCKYGSTSCIQVLDIGAQNGSWKTINQSRQFQGHVPYCAGSKWYTIVSGQLFEMENNGIAWKTVDKSPADLKSIVGSWNCSLLCLKSRSNHSDFVITRHCLASGAWEVAVCVPVADIQKHLSENSATESGESLSDAAVTTLVPHSACVVGNIVLVVASYQENAVTGYFVLDIALSAGCLTSVTSFPVFAQAVSAVKALQWNGRAVVLVTLVDGTHVVCGYNKSKSDVAWQQTDQRCLAGNKRMWLIGNDVVFVGDNHMAIPTCVCVTERSVGNGKHISLPGKWQAVCNVAEQVYVTPLRFVSQ